jgi:(p)ppGpp synthase/HD superfamily hydrolase
MEDTDVTLEQVEQKFGNAVSDLVWAVTEHNKKLPWKKRKEAYIQQAKENPIEALQIMCADKLDNLGQIHRDLQQNGKKVWTRFTRSQDRALTRELQSIFENVFEIQSQNNQ